MKLSRRAVVAGGVAAVGAAGAAIYYAKAGNGGKGKALSGLATGAMAKLEIAEAPMLAPTYGFFGPDGEAVTLSDLKGQALVVNLWAMWCAPCRIEMPTLAQLTQALGDEARVITVNVDHEASQREAGKAFLAEHPPLPFYTDPKFQLPFELPGKGAMPQTVLIDRAGQVRAWLRGEANWASAEALAAVRAAAAL